jgi:hypothetical protein
MIGKRTRYTFYIEPDVRAALTAIKARSGAPESETIRRILRAGLAAELKAAGRSKSTRK